jgi:hypothetical protein
VQIREKDAVAGRFGTAAPAVRNRLHVPRRADFAAPAPARGNPEFMPTVPILNGPYGSRKSADSKRF